MPEHWHDVYISLTPNIFKLQPPKYRFCWPSGTNLSWMCAFRTVKVFWVKDTSLGGHVKVWHSFSSFAGRKISKGFNYDHKMTIHKLKIWWLTSANEKIYSGCVVQWLRWCLDSWVRGFFFLEYLPDPNQISDRISSNTKISWYKAPISTNQAKNTHWTHQ